MPRDDEDQGKLTQGLVGRLLSKFPNASPGALERLAEEAKSNPLSITAVPSYWADITIDPAEPKSTSTVVSSGPIDNYSESLSYKKVQDSMAAAMAAMKQQLGAPDLGYNQQSMYGNAYSTLASQQSGYPTYGGQSREYTPTAPAPKPVKPLEIAAPSGKRAFLLDDEI